MDDAVRSQPPIDPDRPFGRFHPSLIACIVLGLVLGLLAAIGIGAWFITHELTTKPGPNIEEQTVIGRLRSVDLNVQTTTGHPLSDTLAVPDAQYELNVFDSGAVIRSNSRLGWSDVLFLARLASSDQAHAALAGLESRWVKAGAVMIAPGAFRWTIPAPRWHQMRAAMIAQGLRKMLATLHRTTYEMIATSGPFVALSQPSPSNETPLISHVMARMLKLANSAG